MKIGFRSHFSDNSAQNFATTFDNMKKLIHWMYDNNLFVNYSIIYAITYRFIKKYICANSMWILSILVFTHRVIIDRYINSPGRDRIKIDCINGSDKTCFKNKL